MSAPTQLQPGRRVLCPRAAIDSPTTRDSGRRSRSWCCCLEQRPSPRC